MSPRQATKSLGIPAQKRPPSFREVATLAVMGAAFGEQSVCVLCLTQELLERWMSELEHLRTPITLLDVLNTNHATLADWEKFLSGHAYDITIVHGACAELRAGRISVGYVKALVDAVPSGLVILA